MQNSAGAHLHLRALSASTSTFSLAHNLPSTRQNTVPVAIPAFASVAGSLMAALHRSLLLHRHPLPLLQAAVHVLRLPPVAPALQHATRAWLAILFPAQTSPSEFPVSLTGMSENMAPQSHDCRQTLY